jgi:hypothetical protein
MGFRVWAFGVLGSLGFYGVFEKRGIMYFPIKVPTNINPFPPNLSW